MKRYFILWIIGLLPPLLVWAQGERTLSLPRLEQLSSDRVLQVIQDSEGFLWYATEGGGVCRDDGRRMVVFRSDTEHPDLLGSNNVACVAEAGKRFILIGTFHGAHVLDKQDYSIRRLEEVDDKRVDDIVVGRNGHWWLTANKKVYEYAADGQLLNTYEGGDKYIFRLHEDKQGRLWGMEWEGGQLRLDHGRLVQITTEWPDSFDFRRISADSQGRLLVADGFGNCYALDSAHRQRPWFDGQVLSRFMADSVRMAKGLSERPTAIASDAHDALWFSTGKDIRCMRQGKESIVLPDTRDVSAMTFTKDGTLWLATIFGNVMSYREGNLADEDDAANEYGDAIVALLTDKEERLVMVSDRYVRLYDPMRHTLCQQNIEDEGVYRIELQETQPGKRWSQPEQEVVERLPIWAWWLMGVLLMTLAGLIVHVRFLHRQRSRFLAAMKKETPATEQPLEKSSALENEWLQKAIARVEKHLDDDSYSVEQLSNDLCMSRMTFYRKIQSATGQKPTEFIRTIRLRRAAELLHEGRLTITEISDATGFSSVSYFSRCFRTMYGVSPTQFGKTTTAEGLPPSEMPN